MKPNLSLAGAALAAACLAVPGGALAQAPAWPTETIRVVAGFPAGSGADIMTRYYALKLQQLAKVTVIVENKVGAAGVFAMEQVARAKPDGYTILLGTGTSTAAAPALIKGMSFDPQKSLRVAATLTRQGFIIAVDSKSPYKTIQELTAGLKEKGAKANYATAAVSGIVLAEVYKAAAGVTPTEVRFRTTNDSLNEFIAGNLDFGSLDPQIMLAQQRAGRMRLLAIGTKTRLESMPDIPTLAETVAPGADLTGWWTAMVPTDTPQPIVEKLHGWFNEISAMPETKKFAAEGGGDVYVLSLKEGDELFKYEEKHQAELLKAAKIEQQ